MTDKKLKPVIEYYGNGTIKRAYSVDENGIEQGPYEEYYNKGQLKIKCTCKDGEFNGLCKSYHDNGQLWEKVVYRMGEILYGKEAEEYLQEWEASQPQKVRKGLNARLRQISKKMPATAERQSAKRAEVAKFRAKFPNKKDGR